MSTVRKSLFAPHHSRELSMEVSDMSDVHEVLLNVPDDPKYRFMLYIAGDTDLSRRAEANLRQIIETCLPRQYVIEVIDVIVNPRAALQDRVTITPMAVKTVPVPMRKVIGDFTDRDKVLSGLGIAAGKPHDE
jgi:circadian clock protein KaiB